jgi:hypothetical protein
MFSSTTTIPTTAAATITTTTTTTTPVAGNPPGFLKETRCAFLELVERGDRAALTAWCDTRGRHGSASTINDAVSRSGLRALEALVSVDDVELTSVLLGCRELDVNALFPVSGSTALISAASLGSNELVALLLAHEAIDVNARDLDRSAFVGQLTSIVSCGGRTALHVACEKGNAEIVQLLLAKSARTDLLDNNGRSALDLAERALVLVHEKATRKQEALKRIRALLLRALDRPPDSPLPLLERAKTDTLEDERQTRLRAKAARVAERQRVAADDRLRVESFHCPLNRALFAGKGIEWLNDTFEPSQIVPLPPSNLVVVPALTPAGCDAILREVRHYEACAMAADSMLPLFVRHDDNIGSLERCGFMPILSELIDRVVNKNLALLVPGATTKAVARHAFVTRNWVGRTQEFAKFKTHRDKSAITLNICLELSGDVLGSEVLFFKAPRAGEEQPSDETDVVGLYAHRLGHAVLHTGDHWHRTVPIERGSRACLIVWAALEE